MTEKEYEDMLDMFQLPAWKSYIEEAEELLTALKDAAVDYADTNDKWQFARGRMTQLRAVVGYENLVRAAWKAQQQQTESDDEPLII
jgi:cbb3-type cytochrome oxidase cytochrome c subunit